MASLRPHGATCLLSTRRLSFPFHVRTPFSVPVVCRASAHLSAVPPACAQVHLALRVVAVTAGLSFSPDHDLVLFLITKVQVLTRHSNGAEILFQILAPRAIVALLPARCGHACPPHMRRPGGQAGWPSPHAGFHTNILAYFSPNPRPGHLPCPHLSQAFPEQVSNQAAQPPEPPQKPVTTLEP